LIRPISDLPGNVLGFELVGRITTEDYREALDPILEQAAQHGQKMRVLVVLGPEFEGFEGGAILEDARLGLRTWSAWERIAIVTDDRAIADVVHLLGWLVPGEVQVFPIDDVGAATVWAAES